MKGSSYRIRPIARRKGNIGFGPILRPGGDAVGRTFSFDAKFYKGRIRPLSAAERAFRTISERRKISAVVMMCGF